MTGNEQTYPIKIEATIEIQDDVSNLVVRFIGIPSHAVKALSDYMNEPINALFVEFMKQQNGSLRVMPRNDLN